MNKPNRPQGPNVKKLIVRKMSFDAIPDGGGFADGLRFLTDRERLLKSAREATEWVFAAIDSVKAVVWSEKAQDWRIVQPSLKWRSQRHFVLLVGLVSFGIYYVIALVGSNV